MDKYGVVTDKEKNAEKGKVNLGICPWCGAELERRTGVPKCPVHGTEPFEKPKDTQDHEF